MSPSKDLIAIIPCGAVLSHSCWLSETLWTVAHQAPPSMGPPRKEYWSGLPVPSTGDLPNPGIKPTCPASPELAGSFFTMEPPGKLTLITLQSQVSNSTSLQKGHFKVFWETNHYPKNKSNTTTHKIWLELKKIQRVLRKLPLSRDAKICRFCMKYMLSGYVLSASQIWLFLQHMLYEQFFPLLTRNKAINKTKHLAIQIKVGVWNLKVDVQWKTQLSLLITSKLFNKCSSI